MGVTQEATGTAKPGRDYFLILSILLVLVNALLIIRAISQGGWAALGLLMIACPIFNGVMLLAGMIKAIALERKHPGVRFGTYWALAILLPLVLSIVGLGILFSGVTGGGC